MLNVWEWSRSNFGNLEKNSGRTWNRKALNIKVEWKHISWGRNDCRDENLINKKISSGRRA